MIRRGAIQWVTALASLVGLLVGCGVGSTAGGQQSSGPVKIGGLVNLTGRYALTAAPMQNGIQMAVEDVNAAGGINGRQIELSIDDLGETNDSAINAFNKALAADPAALVGMAVSTQVFAGAPLVKKAAVPTLASGTNPRLKNQADWLFATNVTDDISAKMVATFLVQDLRKTKIAILHINDEYGNTGSQIITDTVNSLGGTIVANETMAAGDKDVSAQLLNIRRAGAEAVAIWLTQSDMAVAIKQMRVLGLDVTIIAAPLLAATIKTLTPEEADGVYTQINALPMQSDDPKVVEWSRRYEDKFHLEADSYAAMGYDSIMMLVDAIKRGGTEHDALRHALLETKDFKGMSGTHTADGSGGLAHQGLIAQITGGGYKAVKAVAGD